MGSSCERIVGSFYRKNTWSCTEAATMWLICLAGRGSMVWSDQGQYTTHRSALKSQSFVASCVACETLTAFYLFVLPPCGRYRLKHLDRILRPVTWANQKMHLIDRARCPYRILLFDFPSTRMDRSPRRGSLLETRESSKQDKCIWRDRFSCLTLHQKNDWRDRRYCNAE